MQALKAYFSEATSELAANRNGSLSLKRVTILKCGVFAPNLGGTTEKFALNAYRHLGLFCLVWFEAARYEKFLNFRAHNVRYTQVKPAWRLWTIKSKHTADID